MFFTAGGQENIILQNQGDVVVHPDEARGLQNVVVGEGVVDGDEHREDVEGQKQQGVGRQKRIAELHVLRSVPRDARIALSQRKVLFPEPDSPTTAANSPFSSEKDTFFKAFTFASPFP